MYNKHIVKIVDLGCSNFYGSNIIRKTTIGTKIYYSPEMLLLEEQDDKLDIWCLGIILFELVFLQSPFNDPDMEKKIRVSSYQFRKYNILSPKMPSLTLTLKIYS